MKHIVFAVLLLVVACSSRPSVGTSSGIGGNGGALTAASSASASTAVSTGSGGGGGISQTSSTSSSAASSSSGVIDAGNDAQDAATDTGSDGAGPPTNCTKYTPNDMACAQQSPDYGHYYGCLNGGPNGPCVKANFGFTSGWCCSEGCLPASQCAPSAPCGGQPDGCGGMYYCHGICPRMSGLVFTCNPSSASYGCQNCQPLDTSNNPNSFCAQMTGGKQPNEWSCPDTAPIECSTLNVSGANIIVCCPV